MRALRIPLADVPPDRREGDVVPAWIIDGQRRHDDQRREAPRLEVPAGEPFAPPDEPATRDAPSPGSTVIVIPL